MWWGARNGVNPPERRFAGRWRRAAARVAPRRWRSGGGQIRRIGHAATARPGRPRWGTERQGSQRARVAGPAVAGGEPGGWATGTLAKRRSQ